MENDFEQPLVIKKRSINDILTNGFKLDVGAAFNRGSDIWKQHMGGFLGYTIVGFVGIFICGLVPFLGSLASSLIISPAFIAGYYLIARKISSNNSVIQSDYTSGFKQIGNNLLYIILSFVIMIIVFLPMIIMLLTEAKSLFSIFMEIKTVNEDGDNETKLDLLMQLLHILKPTMGVGALCLLIALFVSLLFIEVYPLINVYGLNALDAIKVSSKIVLKAIPQFLILALLFGLLNIAGTLCLLVGLLFTIPLSYCMLYAAYEQIFEGH